MSRSAARASAARRAPDLSLAGLSLDTLTERVRAWGQPAYRAKQLFHAMHGEGLLDAQRITTLPQALRELIRADAPPATTVVEDQQSADGTRKLLLGLADGRRVEAVLIPDGKRRTVCVSSQVGCPLRCVFCASGVRGLLRNLDTSEIVEPVVHMRRLLGARPTNIVLMGMGEPLLNLDHVADAIRIWTHPEGMGMSPRRITVSTALTPAGIERLADLELGVHLAVSLHAPNDTIRANLVPDSPAGRTEALLDAAANYAERSGRDATAEYVLIAGENDHPDHAAELARLVAGRHIHVNLIPLNPVGHRPDLQAPSATASKRFVEALRTHGATATLRTRKGDDIDAACGQLALERAAPEQGRRG